MVDLPMPGSPPISVAEAETTPPPITRSNSPMPHCVRAAAESCTSVRRTGRDVGKSAAALPRYFGSGADTSSTRVFHSPHPGHFPTHLGEEVPHTVHAYSTLTFATSPPPRAPLRR